MRLVKTGVHQSLSEAVVNRNEEEYLRHHQEVIRTPLTSDRNLTLIKSDVNIHMYLHLFSCSCARISCLIFIFGSEFTDTVHHDVREVIAAEIEASEYITRSQEAERDER